MKRLACLLAALTLLLCAPALAGDAPEPAGLTLMIYMTGSDLESKHGAASAELAEIAAAVSGAQGLRVVVMASGAKAWEANVAPEETAIYEVTAAGLAKVQAGPLRSMGEADTLLSLLEYGHEHYPARDWALILWDHGAGPVQGLCFDELFPGEGGMDSLSLAELAEALARSPFAQEPLAWIGFDACLMACVETAAAVAPYAAYMIASQDTEPASGWDYGFLTGVAQDASPLETGRRIIDAYFDSLADAMATITLSMTDLSAIPAVMAGMDDLFGNLTVDAEGYAALAACRANTKAMANMSPAEFDLVDLIDLLEVWEDAGVAACAPLLEAIGQAVVYARSNTAYINGLSVYYPYYDKATYRTHRAESAYRAPGYQGFLEQVTRIWLGEALVDWRTGLSPVVTAEDGGITVSLQLTAEQAQHVGSAQLYILEEVGESEYRMLSMNEEVALTADHRLQARYEGRALFLVDAQGAPLTDAVSYYAHDGALRIPVVLLRVDEETFHVDQLPAYLICQPDGQGGYALAEVLEITDQPGLFGKSDVRLSDWQEMRLVGYASTPAYDDTGAMLRYGLWETGAYVTIESVPLDQAWQPAFLNLHDHGNRYALLQVWDDQNNVAYVSLQPIPAP